MRLPLATDLKARVGTPDKDARVKNGIVEIRGESSLVRQRPGVSEALATGLGLYAQGGMAFGEYEIYINDNALYMFYQDGVLFGAYGLDADADQYLFSGGFNYRLGDRVFYKDPETSSYEPWFPYAKNPIAPPSTDPFSPGYWLWGKEPPTASWQWEIVIGAGTGTVVTGYGSCAAATQGYISATTLPESSFTNIVTGCRTYDMYLYNIISPEYRVPSTLGGVVQVTSTPL